MASIDAILVFCSTELTGIIKALLASNVLFVNALSSSASINSNSLINDSLLMSLSLIGGLVDESTTE